MLSSVDESSVHSRVIPLAPFLAQHAWGKQGPASLAARLYFQNTRSPLSRKARYSEVCIGTHASAPTRIAYDHSVTLLDHIRTEVIEVDPEKVDHYARLHKSGLPFLLKILSVSSPQAVHVHPDSVDAARLHATHPDVYPDAAGKAEMAVALSTVDALVGFRPAANIVAELARVPEFADVVGRPTTDNFVKIVKTGRAGPKDLRTLFMSFMDCAAEKISSCLRAVVKRFSKMPRDLLTSDDTLLLSLHTQFPDDRMCFCVYFLNRVKVEPGSAVFIHPKEPHAYLHGELIEISSCSVNVVRAGLTSAPVDKDAFVKLLTYNDSPVEVSSKSLPCALRAFILPPANVCFQRLLITNHIFSPCKDFSWGKTRRLYYSFSAACG